MKNKVIVNVIEYQGNNWIKGLVDGHPFYAKVYTGGSIYGINEGNVSKLEIKDRKGQTIVNYDRDWDIKPNKNTKPLVNAIVKFFNGKSPEDFESKYSEGGEVEQKNIKCNVTGKSYNVKKIVEKISDMPQSATFRYQAYTDDGMYNIYVTPNMQMYAKLDTLKYSKGGAVDGKFSKGFLKGDILSEEQRSPQRYIEVKNGGKTFIVGDNGERRQVVYSNGDMKFIPPINKPALKGDLSLEQLKSTMPKYGKGGEIEAKRTELNSQLEKAKKQLKVAKEQSAPENVIAFAQKKIERIDAEIKALEVEPKVEPKQEKAKSNKSFIDFEDELTTMVEDKFNADRGDAQGMVEAKMDEPKKLYDKGLSVSQAFSQLFDAKKKSEVKKPTSKQSKEATAVHSVTKRNDDDFEVSDKDGVTLVASKLNKNWVMNIEKKDDKFEVNCCSEDYKHPKFESKAKAIEYCKEFLHCKNLLNEAKTNAKKRIEQSKKYKAKGGETNVVMTVKNTLETVENKVEKISDSGKKITVSQANQLDKALSRIVATIKVAMKSEKDGKEFVKKLIEALKKLI